MTTVLIVVGAVIFLALDGLISRFRRGAGGWHWPQLPALRPRRYGAIPVPGQTTVNLRAGKLKLSYQESYKAGGGEDSIDFDVPAALQVRVESPSGETLAIKQPGGSALSTGSGWSRALIGTAKVTQPGLHTVTAGGELHDAVEPQVLIGK